MDKDSVLSRRLVVVAILAMAMVILPSVTSLPTGVDYGLVQDGCNCHSSAASDSVTASIDGVPESYNKSETYTLTVSFTGGPGTEGNENVGGFNLWTSAGTLTSLDSSTQLNSPQDATHAEEGNNQRSWTLEWTAPDNNESNIEFTLHTNSVNGDGSASSADMWNRAEATAFGFGPEPLENADPFKVLATLIVVSVVLLSIVVLYVFYRNNPDGFEWARFAPWITEWLTSTDHKKIGTLYFVQGLFFLGVGGIMAMMIRVQLSSPGNDFISQDYYNQFFTLHGTTMIFLAAMPLIAGFANWIVPLQIGAPDLAFPRLNALSFWLQPVSALLIFTGVFSGAGADTGWTGYAPYVVTETAHAGVSMWAAGQIMLVASSTLTGINFLTTIAVMRAPGMGWFQMPLFTWSILVANLMLFLSIPAFGVGLIQVLLDRTIGTAFYDVAAGGDPLLWSHLFWYFGHPEVYVVIVPAFGVISEVIATSARRSIFGYKSMVYAMAGIGLVSFIVYGHHMFTSGMSPTLRFVTMLTTMLVAVPTGIKIFNWLKTMHGGSLVYRTHTLWTLGFLVTFTLGGISGMFFPSMGMDVHLHETYFVVAHFHYVLVGGTVFGFYAAIYYWYPKMTGRMLDEKLGVLHFLTGFISYNAVFWPMHRLGVIGMIRRTHTYYITTDDFQALPEWAADWNMMISVSAFLFFASNLFMVANMIKSLFRGEKAPADPWGGWSFEWMTSSPPPTPSFDPHNIPTLMNANEHVANEPGKLGKWFQRLMVADDAAEEGSH